MCTSRNKRKHAIWSRLPCPLQKILLLHRSQFHQEGRMLIFHKRFGLKQRRTFLADSTEQRLVNVLKFICNNSQWTIDSSKWKKSGSPWLLFQANRLTLCYGSPQAKVTRRVEWDIASGALKTQRAVRGKAVVMLYLASPISQLALNLCLYHCSYFLVTDNFPWWLCSALRQ